MLDRSAEPYFATLDGNEQYEEVDAVIALWRRIGAEPRLARLKSAILFVEQPITRANALAKPVHALAGEVPIEIDKSDADIGVFPAAARSAIAASRRNRARDSIARSSTAPASPAGTPRTGANRYFMSAEDLTTQGGVAVQQDLALATLVGATHVERNGHHYVDGMAGAPEQEQRAFLTAHPDLYRRADGRVRLAIRDGALALASLARRRDWRSARCRTGVRCSRWT